MNKVPPVNVEDKELWLEINTFQCKYGRFSPEACEKLRERAEQLSSAKKIDEKTYLTKPFCCKECREWKKLSEEVYEKRKRYLEQLKTQNEKKIKKEERKKKKNVKIIICPLCKKEKRLYARGLCAACYDKVYRKNRKKKKKKR